METSKNNELKQLILSAVVICVVFGLSVLLGGVLAKRARINTINEIENNCKTY